MWENVVPSSVSRSKQDGIVKSNTALLSAKMIRTDKNSKEFQSTWKQKNQVVSRQKSFSLFASKTFTQIMYVYTVSNLKPCQILLILNSVLS